MADAAYISSRALAFEECKALDGRHLWDDGSLRWGDDEEVVGEWLCGAAFRYDMVMPEVSHVGGRGRIVLINSG